MDKEINNQFDFFKEVKLDENGALVVSSAGVGVWSDAQIADSVRKSLNPYKLVTYLNINTPYTTSSLAIGVPTKLLIPTTQVAANGFAIGDTGGGNFAFIFTSVESGATYPFEVRMITSITASVNNVELIVDGYMNGSPMNGVTGETKITTGGEDVQVVMMSEATIADGNYIELYVTVNKVCTLTFHRTAINVIESN